MTNLRRLLAALLLIAAPSSAQKTESLVIVPFVGCPADGQVGPEPAPHGQPKHFTIPQSAAARLAWYEYRGDPGQIGALGPRGWNCFATIGSNGMNLYIAPEPLSSAKVLEHKNWHGFTGPAIQLSAILGGTSGRFGVAQIAARVFPHYRPFAKKVIAEGLEPASDFHFGPFPTDKLTYKSNHLVEFITPSNTAGLGTESWIAKGPGPITGFAWIGGEDTDVLLLNMRLPPALASIGPVIIAQAEREAAQPQP
jgi:hypothetical protein